MSAECSNTQTWITPTHLPISFLIELGYGRVGYTCRKGSAIVMTRNCDEYEKTVTYVWREGKCIEENERAVCVWIVQVCSLCALFVQSIRILVHPSSLLPLLSGSQIDKHMQSGVGVATRLRQERREHRAVKRGRSACGINSSLVLQSLAAELPGITICPAIRKRSREREKGKSTLTAMRQVNK